MPSCDTVAKCPLPCTLYGSCKMFKIFASDFGTVGMSRRPRACAHEFLTIVTEGVVQGVYNTVTLLMQYGDIRQVEVNGYFATVLPKVIYEPRTVVEGHRFFTKRGCTASENL